MWGDSDDSYSCLFCNRSGDIIPSDVSDKFTTGCPCGARFKVQRSTAEVVFVEELPSRDIEVHASTELTLDAADYDDREALLEAARKQFEQNPESLNVRAMGASATEVIPSEEDEAAIDIADLNALLEDPRNQDAIRGVLGQYEDDYVEPALNTLTGRFINMVEYRVAPVTVRNSIETRINERDDLPLS